MLGKKQSVSNNDWIKAMAEIKTIAEKADIKKLEQETISLIREKIAGKKSAYAWSGGKDSLVLGAICEKAGIKDCMIGICDLEYPDFIKWVNEHKPSGLQIINTGQDIKWLARHLAMLFPQDSSKAARWFSIIQHAAQEQYFKDNGLDLLLLGRRKADGNYVGKGNIYTNAKGITRYSPLADWSHEQILAYIYYNKIEMPPIYSWANGYKCGTHPWAARQYTQSIENGWKEIFDIDKSIVEAAAEHIQSAAKFLEEARHEPK